MPLSALLAVKIVHETTSNTPAYLVLAGFLKMSVWTMGVLLVARTSPTVTTNTLTKQTDLLCADVIIDEQDQDRHQGFRSRAFISNHINMSVKMNDSSGLQIHLMLYNRMLINIVLSNFLMATATATTTTKLRNLVTQRLSQRKWGLRPCVRRRSRVLPDNSDGIN